MHVHLIHASHCFFQLCLSTSPLPVIVVPLISSDALSGGLDTFVVESV
jgi:hypothetical protein